MMKPTIWLVKSDKLVNPHTNNGDQHLITQDQGRILQLSAQRSECSGVESRTLSNETGMAVRFPKISCR